MRRRQIPVLAVSVVLAGVVGYGLTGTANAKGGDTHLRAQLRGTNEVPPADPDGHGRAGFEFTVADGEVCFEVVFTSTGTPNRAHIHVGAAGVNGGIVVPLFELGALPADERNDALERGRLADCVPADPAILAQIEANPAGFYCNLHNSRFPAGAIRGQLEGRT
jgi:hypothetical protein